MKSVVEITRMINSKDEEEIKSKLFELVKSDKEWLGHIVMDYCEYITPQVKQIIEIVDEFNREEKSENIKK